MDLFLDDRREKLQMEDKNQTSNCHFQPQTTESAIKDSSSMMIVIKEEPNDLKDVNIEVDLQTSDPILLIPSGNMHASLTINNVEHMLADLWEEMGDKGECDDTNSINNNNKRQQPHRKSKSKQSIETTCERAITSCKICGDKNSELSSKGYCEECEIDTMSLLTDSPDKTWSSHEDEQRSSKIPHMVLPNAKCRQRSKNNSSSAKVNKNGVRYNCSKETCVMVYKTEEQFELHKQSFHSGNPVTHMCRKCAHCCNNYQSFMDHLETHKDRNIFHCDLCDRKYTLKSSLTGHKKTFHNKLPDYGYKCSYCGKEFQLQPNLTTHKMKIHGVYELNGMSPCSFCGKMFPSRVLGVHENTHTGNKPYKCTNCGKEFAHPTALTRHMLIHTGAQPHKCDVCELRFSQKHSLKRHQLVHTGEKPYACGVCGQRFTQRPYMLIHERTKHDGDSNNGRKRRELQKLKTCAKEQTDSEDDSE